MRGSEGTRRRLAIAGIALALSAVPAAAPSAAGAAMQIGVQDDPVFLSQAYGPPAGRSTAFARARAFGARWLRINVIWSDYARHGFTQFDSAVNAARAAGFNVQLTITGTPSYDSRGNRRLSWYKPSPTRFKSFVTAVATHFKGRVFRYSLWNEANLGRWLAPTSQAPKLYRKLILAAYPAIKRVDGRDQVLIGELTSSHNPLGFLRRVASGLKADGLAYHPFEPYKRPGSGGSNRGFVGINSTPAIKAALRDLARRHRLTTLRGGTLPLYYTEFGYLTKGFYRMSESRRRDWTVRAFRYARRQGVKEMLYYQLVQSPNGTLAGDIWDSGIVRLNGSALPTYTALVSAARHGFR
jgi:polysaccharide biosynthesis protein PslG